MKKGDMQTHLKRCDNNSCKLEEQIQKWCEANKTRDFAFCMCMSYNSNDNILTTARSENFSFGGNECPLFSLIKHYLTLNSKIHRDTIL